MNLPRMRRLSARGFALAAFALGFLVSGSFFLLTSFHNGSQRRLVIQTYLDLEQAIIERTADMSERWFRSRLGSAPIPAIEDEVFRFFVDPIRVLRSGDAWIYNRDYVIYDQSSDFPSEYRGKPIDEIFRIQARRGASHYASLVDGVLNAGSGRDWYLWLPGKGPEWAAWESFRIGDHTWTIGLSTPEKEILEYYGLDDRGRIGLIYCCAMALVCFASAFILSRWYARNLALNAEREKAVDDLKAANEAKNAFLAVVSHELRNPLNAIIGLSGLDLSSEVQSGLHDDLEVIHSSGNRLLGLVNDLLDLSKVEAGKMEFESVDFDLYAQLSSALAPFREAAERKGVFLDLSIEDGTPRFMRGDPLRLGQVVMNLASNAMKFTESGAVIVELSPADPGNLAATDQRRLAIRCVVRDTGIGIAEDKQSRLFREFSQVDPSIGRKYGGTGLGLSICKRLVALFGGEIGVDSRPGEGSAFWFTARFEPGSEAAAAGACEDEEAIASADCALDILVVDDDAVNAAVARRYAERYGHRVACVGTGEEAIAAVKERAFDLVLLDLGLPDMDGLEACGRILAESGPRGSRRIAAMTGRADSATRAACASAGMIDCLCKPVESAALGSILKLVEREKTRLGPRAAAAVAGRALEEAGRDEAASSAVREGEALLDEAALLARVDGDRAFMLELLSIFAAEEAEHRASLESAVAALDAKALRKAAHKIKGTALALNALPLAQAAAALESASSACLRSEGQAEAASFDPALAPLADKVVELLALSADAASQALRGEGAD